jgi:hypothetical protein
MKRLVLLIPAVASLAVLYCGAVEPVASTEKVATKAAPTQGLPTPTPRADQLPAAAWDLTLGPIRKHPPQLDARSDPLPPDKVEQLWVEFLRGSRMRVTWGVTAGERQVNLNLAFCDDMTGRVLNIEEKVDSSFVWTVRQDGAGRWNDAILEFTISRINNPAPRTAPVGHTFYGLLFVMDDGPHYVDPMGPVTFSELGACPA